MDSSAPQDDSEPTLPEPTGQPPQPDEQRPAGWPEAGGPDLAGPAGWLPRLAARLQNTPRRSLAVLAALSVLLLAAAAAGGWYWLARSQTVGKNEAPDTPPSSLESLATEFPELAGILQDPKLDSVYKDFLVAYQEGGEEAALALAEKRGLLNANGDLRLTLELNTTDTAALQSELEANGIQVTAVSDNLMDIAIPMDLLEVMMEDDSADDLLAGLTHLDEIERIRLPKVGVSDAGSVETESMAMIAADAWNAAGVTGKGVKVGVLDLGFDNYRRLLGSDLPDSVVAQSFITGVDVDQTGTAHGAAVAEIIHDIAPEAELYFAAYETDVEEREAVSWLLSQGVQIISHSAGSLYGPMDGTTEEARWVDSIVDGGVLWVNSAGNTGYTHYRATFTDEDGDGYHEFDTGDELMGFIPDERVVMVVNWDDWGNGSQDLDLYIFDPNGEELASSTNTQDGPEDDSAEDIVYNFSDQRTYFIAIYAKHVTRPVVIDFFFRDGAIEYYTPEHSVTTPGDARRALTVGAVNWSNDALEDYSSRGPTGDGRLKPELSAPAGVSSAAFGTTWDGTSASAPHVSGAAALVLQAFPNYTPDQVKDFLISRAIDLGPGGPDTGYGYGRLYLGQAPDLAALIVATPTPLPPNTPTVPAAPGATATITATPERRDLATPGTAAGGGSVGLALGLAICVVIPAVLGLGGIGLVAGVWYVTRNRRKARRGRPPRRPPGGGYPPLAYPPAGPGPRPVAPLRPQSEIENMCPRCGSEHRPGARFCPVCGLALASELYTDAERPIADLIHSASAAPPGPPPAEPPAEIVFCNQCGQPLRPTSKFCPRCGAPRSGI